ncbi:MAG: hypothetical protein SNJ70_03665 [Armatimonadota bacterium]
MAFKDGDRVILKSRPVSPADEKSGLYFSYFGGLIGKIDRIYEDKSICVDIDINCLEPSMRERHIEVQERERKKWLKNLSREARSRLTPEQKLLTFNYRILVNENDLEIYTGPDPEVKTLDTKIDDIIEDSLDEEEIDIDNEDEE